MSGFQSGANRSRQTPMDACCEGCAFGRWSPLADHPGLLFVSCGGYCHDHNDSVTRCRQGVCEKGYPWSDTREMLNKLYDLGSAVPLAKTWETPAPLSAMSERRLPCKIQDDVRVIPMFTRFAGIGQTDVTEMIQRYNHSDVVKLLGGEATTTCEANQRWETLV